MRCRSERSERLYRKRQYPERQPAREVDSPRCQPSAPEFGQIQSQRSRRNQAGSQKNPDSPAPAKSPNVRRKEFSGRLERDDSTPDQTAPRGYEEAEAFLPDCSTAENSADDGTRKAPRHHLRQSSEPRPTDSFALRV